MKAFICRCMVALALGLLPMAGAHADVVIGGTRVVMPAGQGEVTLPITNEGRQPALVQVWIDKGNAKATPATVHTPFLLTPPLFRINPGKQQNLRILYTGAGPALPADRESLFWLNVLEVPPKPSGAAAGKNTLQFAVRSRLKVFYRPDNLPGSSVQAPAQLVFRSHPAQGKRQLQVHNPSAYFITITGIILPGPQAVTISASGMVAPYGDLDLALQDTDPALPPGTRFTFTTINDFGGRESHQAMVQK